MKINNLVAKITLKHILIFIGLAILGVSAQGYLASIGKEYTRYNNYVIFKQAFEHLLLNKNLYIEYAQEHRDLYKYSPAFALFMGLFYYLPDYIGLLLFNMLNVGVFLWGLSKLQFNNDTLKYILLFLLLEMGISLTFTQTNLLIAGLIMLAFSNMENKNPALASLCIVLTVFIKLFGIVAFVLWLLYPKKNQFAIYTIIWFVLLAFVPLSVISFDSLIAQYQNWLVLLQNDHSAAYGISFLGWIHSWFGINISTTWMVGIGAAIFCMPLLFWKRYKSYFFRLQILASILLWVVIFNHKGENPTYIIAVAGVAIWYFSQQRTMVAKTLLWLCFIFTTCSSTDLVTPGKIINAYVEPYSIKAVFCCVIWMKLIFDLVMHLSKRARHHFKSSTPY